MKTAKKVEKGFSMKKSVVLGMLGICLAFVFIFSGCAAFNSLKRKGLGTLTITGIPAEYEGGTVDSSQGGYAGDYTGTISNGSVSLKVYAVSDKTGAANLEFDITKAGSSSVGIFFESVTFANQTASVNWADGVMTGLLTVTGIPADYNRNVEEHIGQVTILVGKELRKGGALALLGGYTGSEATNIGFVKDGALSVPLWFMVDGLPTPFTQSTEMRVLLSIGVGSGATVGNAGATVLKTERFIFESVQFTNGNASISLSQGTKQE
jgi:hypothetical protein